MKNKNNRFYLTIIILSGALIGLVNSLPTFNLLIILGFILAYLLTAIWFGAITQLIMDTRKKRSGTFFNGTLYYGTFIILGFTLIHILGFTLIQMPGFFIKLISLIGGNS